MKKKIGIGSIIIIVAFVLFSVSIILIGITEKSNIDNFVAKAGKVEARICNIEPYTAMGTKGKKVTKHKVYVDYTVDGIMYEYKQLDIYNSSMRVGDIVEIYYNPEFPKLIMSGDTTNYILLMIAGAGIMTVTILVVVYTSVKRARVNNLIVNGTAFAGKIAAVKAINDKRVKAPYVHQAVCEIINPFTEERYYFNSERVYSDIRYLLGAPIVLYVDNNNPKNYYVDIDKVIHDYRDSRKKQKK